MGMRCRWHGGMLPCVTCAQNDVLRLEAENKQRRRDGIPEHDLTELKKIANMRSL